MSATGVFLLQLAAGRCGGLPCNSADPIACERLVAAAVKEGLAGRFFAEVRAGRIPRYHEQTWRKLESIYYLTVQTNMKYLALLRQIAREGVPFVVMQGAALLITLYDDPGLRPVSDLDLWVLEHERDKLNASLRRLGFDENPLVPGVFRRGSFLVDVHTHLHWAERIRSSRFLFSGNAQGIFERSPLHEAAGTAVRCLDSYDQAVYLIVHALKHNLERLAWLADLNRLTSDWRDQDWSAFRSRARELGQERACAVFAYLRRSLFGLPVPKEASAGLRLGPPARYLLRLRRRGPLPKWSSLFLLSAGSRARQMQFALESTFPRPEVLRQVIPRSESMPSPRLYGLRLKQMVGMMQQP